MALTIDELNIQITAESKVATSAIDALINRLKELSGVLDRFDSAAKKASAGFTTITAAANGVGNTTSKTQNAFTQLTETIKAQEKELQGLNEEYSSYVLKGQQFSADAYTLAKRISELNNELTQNKEKLNNAKTSTDRLTNVTKQLGVESNKSSKEVTKVVSNFSKGHKPLQGFTDKLARNISKWRTLYSVFQNVANTMAEWFKSSNDYVETLNLFNVTMGEGATAAREYADSVSEAMGIDVAEWMDYQGTFKQLTSGFGIVEDKANTMSKNLTQLSYDLASFFNTDVQTAFDKLSSAMAGQVKGLREFGIDTTVASLQEYALAKGIETSVRSMTQAEKSMLRYNYIMENSIKIQGDMARTIATPANSIRILTALLAQMKRALGNIVSVIVVRFIPYVQALVQVVTEAANAIANFLGYKLPEIDYSGLGGGFSDEFEDAEDAVGGVSDGIQAIKKQLMGFDELNILGNPDTSSSGGGVGGGAGGALDMEPIEYDFLAGLKTDKLDEIKEKMSSILNDVSAIALAIAGWKLLNFSNELAEIAPKLSSLLKVAAGITIAVSGLMLEFDGFKEIGNGTADLWDYIKTVLGAGLGLAGSLIAFGTGPAGWIIGITAVLSVGITGFLIGYNEKQLREDIEARFGELALTTQEIKEYAEKLTSSDFALKLNIYVEEEATLDTLKTQVQNSLEALQKYNFKISIGLSIDENSYKIAVDNYIQSATEYLTQKQVVAALSVEILLGDTETGGSLTEFTSTFYTANQQALTTLGAKLKETVEQGFVDGVWIEDKMQEAIDLQKEIQEILDYVSDVEYQAKLSAIKLDVASLDMDKESFKGVLEKAQDTISKQLENLEGIRLETLKVAKMQYDQNKLNGMSEEAAKQIYDTAVKEAQEAFEAGKLELTYGTYAFGLDVIREKYKAEVEKTIPLLKQDTQELWMQGTMAVLPEKTYEDVTMLMVQLQSAYEVGFSNLDISTAARQNIEELVSALQPTKAEMQKIADEAIAAGRAVPENVSKGLSDIAQLEAITGSLEAQAYLIGEKLSTDPTFLELLATAEGAGEAINSETARGIFSNLKVVEDASNGTVTLINDTIGEKTLEITPELVENMNALGVHLSDGLLEGAQGEMETNKKKWYEWAIWPWNWFKDKNEINSPSKLFKRGGQDIVQGLWNGLEEVWRKLKTWWSGLSLSSVSIKMPHFSWSSTPASGWMADILDALGLPTSLPKLNVSWYAQGGFPTMGEMFIAREAGPELVGQIGSKNAVANNDQIISGIEAGVYRAMMAANSGNRGGTQTIRIVNEIDGTVIGEKVIKYHNGVVMQTGESPLLI